MRTNSRLYRRPCRQLKIVATAANAHKTPSPSGAAVELRDKTETKHDRGPRKQHPNSVTSRQNIRHCKRPPPCGREDRPPSLLQSTPRSTMRSTGFSLGRPPPSPSRLPAFHRPSSVFTLLAAPPGADRHREESISGSTRFTHRGFPSSPYRTLHGPLSLFRLTSLFRSWWAEPSTKGCRRAPALCSW